MTRSENREDLRVAISFLRAFRGWNQTEMARAAGMDKSQLSLYELGRKVPSRKTVERLVKAVGLPYSLFEDVLGMVRMVRVAATDLNVASTTVAEDIARAVAASVKLALSQVLAELSREEEEDPFLVSPEDDRAEAEELWGRLQPYSPQDRRLLVGEGREYGSWALVERLCHECGRTAPNDPIEAQEMAELALLVAARTPGNHGWRSRLQGYAWAFLGDARRTAGDASGAEEAFQRARDLWNAGAPESLAFLDEERFRELQPI
jgi:transcriptional regulator with XRE-family HTH domain